MGIYTIGTEDMGYSPAGQRRETSTINSNSQPHRNEAMVGASELPDAVRQTAFPLLSLVLGAASHGAADSHRVAMEFCNHVGCLFLDNGLKHIYRPPRGIGYDEMSSHGEKESALSHRLGGCRIGPARQDYFIS